MDLNGDGMTDILCGAYTYVKDWNPQIGHIGCTYINTGRGGSWRVGGWWMMEGEVFAALRVVFFFFYCLSKLMILFLDSILRLGSVESSLFLSFLIPFFFESF